MRDQGAVEIRDNRSGGANLASGTGLHGLADRIEAFGAAIQRFGDDPLQPSSPTLISLS